MIVGISVVGDGVYVCCLHVRGRGIVMPFLLNM